MLIFSFYDRNIPTLKQFFIFENYKDTAKTSMGRRKEQLMNFSRNPATTTVIPGLGK